MEYGESMGNISVSMIDLDVGITDVEKKCREFHRFRKSGSLKM